MMAQTINHLIALVALLALLNVGSIALWRTMKIAIRPVPRDLVTRSSILLLMAGATACFVVVVAACLLWKLANTCLA
jgi:hypothetical protein